MEREESGTPTFLHWLRCMKGICLASCVCCFIHRLFFVIYFFFVSATFSGFGWTPCFNMKAVQVLIHEAPDLCVVFIIRVLPCSIPSMMSLYPHFSLCSFTTFVAVNFDCYSPYLVVRCFYFLVVHLCC